MSRRSLAFSSILVLAAAKASAEGIGPRSWTSEQLSKAVRWYGQSSLRVELAGKILWFDPVKVPVTEKADLILLTHDHGDHYSLEDIKRLSGPSTLVLAGFDAPGHQANGLTRIRPGDTKQLGAITVEAVPAYNIIKTQFHPRAAGYCGFIVSGAGLRLYDAGDTERIPEMKGLRCDAVFLPLGQTYTMGSVAEAAQAALDVGARIAVPFHFGLYEGSEADSKEFARLLKGKAEVLVLERRKSAP